MRRIVILISIIGSLNAMNGQEERALTDRTFLSACFLNKTEDVRILLSLGPDIDASWQHSTPPQFKGMRALHLCVLADNPDILKLLLEKKADPNATNLQGDAPLMEACCRGQTENVTQLLKHNADPNIVSPHHGATPLMKASGRNHLKIVKLLVENSADINAQRNVEAEENDLVRTALEFASGAGNSQIVKYLLQQGAKELPSRTKVSMTDFTAFFKERLGPLGSVEGLDDAIKAVLSDNEDYFKNTISKSFNSPVELNSDDTLTLTNPAHFVAQHSGDDKCTDYLERRCNTCNVRAFKKCARCESVFYCKQACQRKDWPSHKPVCKKIPKKT